jgi:hypothetical protein
VTPNDVITEARRLLQDTKAPYRNSDAVLLGWVNMTLKRTAVLRPDLFAVIGDIPTTPDTVVQALPGDSIRLMQIFHVKGGGAVTEVNRESLDMSNPGWTSEDAGVPVNFMRHVRNPNRYFLYPRPTSGIVLVGEYVQTPPIYTQNQSIALLPDAYLPIVVDGVVFLAESIDDEHVNSNRAKVFQDNYTQGLGASVSNRVLTDTKSAGMEPKQVV